MSPHLAKNSSVKSMYSQRMMETKCYVSGFGENLDGNGSWKACVKYVDDQFAAYFDGESGLNRKNIIDTRVHCCLYFIPPYGHGLRQIDLEFLKRLQYKVNLIPVIAKADTLTKEEVQRLKNNINKEIEENDIEIYQFPG